MVVSWAGGGLFMIGGGLFMIGGGFSQANEGVSVFRGLSVALNPARERIQGWILSLIYPEN